MNEVLSARACARMLHVAMVSTFLAACSANGRGSADTTPAVSNAPPQLPAVVLMVTPQAIEAGESALLTWSSSNATACEASGSWSGAQVPSDSTGVSTGAKSEGTYSYGLTCTGPGGSDSAVATLVVGQMAAPEVSLQLAPASIRPGDTAVLTWSSTNATTCSGSGGSGSDGWSGARATSDADGFVVGPVSSEGSYSYTLDCTGPGGSSGDSRILTISNTAPAAPPSIMLTASRTQIQPGESTSLSWTAANALSCTASGGADGDGWAGSQPVASGGTSVGPIVTPGTYTYTLTCAGSGGSASASISIAAASNSQSAVAVVDVTIDPVVISAGMIASLAWTTSNVDSCQASGSWSGSKPLVASAVSTGTLTIPGVYSYTLTCSGPGGSVTDTATLTVNPPPATLVSFSALPTNLYVGQSTLLSWASLSADSCTASGGTGSDGWSGTQATADAGKAIGPFASAGVYTYTLSCIGPGGSSGSQSVSVTVSAAMPAATIVSLTTSPNSIQVGDSFTLQWTAANASTCSASGGTGSDGWGGAVPVTNAGLVIGPLGTPGTYTYSLTCSGPGGASSPAAVAVSVGAATPPASIVSFSASPTTVEVGQSVMLAWSTNNATSCTASNGSGSDGWGGAVAVTSAGVAIGPLNAAGTYTYTLDCSGAGGASGPSSVSFDVVAPTPPASVTALTASPNSIQTAQSFLLSWSTADATSCTATGGSGSDGWSGAVAISSAGTSIGPISSAGTFTYTLACTGPGGAGASSSATVTVNPAPVGPPTVSLWANDANPAQIQPGQSLALKWATTNATSCTASGGSGADSWSGSQPTSSDGTSVGVISTPGIYTYTLTCVGAAGSSAASVVVTVLSSPSVDCGIGTPSTALLAPSVSVSSAVNGLCLAGCSITNAPHVIDADTTNFATMSVALGVSAYDSLRVTDSTTTYPAGRKAGFLIAEPGKLLSLSVLENVTVRTLLNGTLQESATAATILELSALGLFADSEEGFIGFTTSKPFNAVRLDLGSLASVSSSVNVYGACVTLE